MGVYLTPLFCYAPPPYFVTHQKIFFRRFSLKCSSASAAPSTVSPECVPTRNPSKNRFFGSILGRFWVISRSASWVEDLTDQKSTQNRPKNRFFDGFRVGTHSGDTVEGAAEALLHFSENRRKKNFLVRNKIGGGA